MLLFERETEQTFSRSKSIRWRRIVPRQGHSMCSLRSVQFILYSYKQPTLHYYITMFLQQFEEPKKKQQPIKRVKKENSAGIRKQHCQKQGYIQSKTIEKEDNHDLFDQLNIGNLKELYIQSQPVINMEKYLVQQQKKSVERMTAPKKIQQIQEKQQEKETQTRMEKVHKFNEAYHKEDHFKERAIATLFTNEFVRIKTKLAEINGGELNTNFVKFIFTKFQDLNAKENITNEELLLSYHNFANEIMTKTEPTLQSQYITLTDLQNLSRKNLFLSGFFTLSKTTTHRLFEEDLLKLINVKEDFNIILQNEHIQQFINKTFTIPYDSAVTKIKPIDSKNQQKVITQKFHANPIPKTTFYRPKQRPKSHISKTEVNPFKLTQTQKDPLKPEDIYKWDRNFHATSIPPTTYKPNMAVTSNQAEIKKRALEMLKYSQFPATMEYLKDYREYSQVKYEKLTQKYSKNRATPQLHSVPDFARSHQMQITQLERTKQQHRQLTKPQPFNLSQHRQKKQYQSMIALHFPQKRNVIHAKPWKQNSIEVKSTLKQEALSDYRKKQKQQKQQKQQALHAKEAKRQRTKVEYTNILKNRVEDELNGMPKPKIYPQSISSNQVKVNMQKIYNEQPLLMQRESAKSKKIMQQSAPLNWQPII